MFPNILASEESLMKMSFDGYFNRYGMNDRDDFAALINLAIMFI